jgi:hypothetical protein
MGVLVEVIEVMFKMWWIRGGAIGRPRIYIEGMLEYHIIPPFPFPTNWAYSLALRKKPESNHSFAQTRSKIVCKSRFPRY